MRLWLSKRGEVPLREQLLTQIILGVVSNDLRAGERLPSTRDVARRYKIHANTVSAAYRELARRGWVEFRRGSGVYIKARAEVPPADGELGLDDMISRFFKAAWAKGHSLADIQSGLRRWSAAQPPDHFLVIEPDPELRRILIAEIGEATGRRVVGAGMDDLIGDGLLAGAVPTAMHTQIEQTAALLPRGTDIIAIRSQSVPGSMQGQKLPPVDALIAVVSCWPGFLQRARAILVAAGLEPAALSLRDARESDWKKGLRSSSFVITDSLMARCLPRGCEARVFRIISDASIKELSDYAEKVFSETL